MSRFLESIAIVDGLIQRLSWHQRRVDQTLNAFYEDTTLDLHAAIQPHANRHTGTVKCRVMYDHISCEVQFSPYRPRLIKTLKLVENPDLAYPFKFADRRAIDDAFAKRNDADDILIVKNGQITDSSIANIAFRRDKEWFTPREPLLKGTMREYLLQHGIIRETNITVDELPSFHGYKLINALLGFASDEYPVSNIHF